jgi:hypothetical protein
VTGGLGALLVSPFNRKWRFSAPAGGVEGSKLCLFSVIMPAKCVPGISPRFHYRRLTFCFLPLAAILESLKVRYFKYKIKINKCGGFFVFVFALEAGAELGEGATQFSISFQGFHGSPHGHLEPSSWLLQIQCLLSVLALV